MDGIKREFQEDEVSLFGWVMLPTFVLYDRRLNQSQKMLYCILRRYSRENGYCFPSIDRISAGMCAQKRSVCYNLAALVRCGLITKIRRVARSNIYKFNDMKDVYTKNGRLNSSVLDDLRFSGEDKNVDLVMKWRLDLDNAKKEKRKPVAKKKEKPLPTEPSVDSKASEVKQHKKPHVPVRSFEATMKAVNENDTKAKKYQDKRRKMREAASEIDELDKEVKPPKEHRFSSRDVENAWRVAANKKWPDTLVSQRWDKVYLSIASKLGQKYGYEFLIDACEQIIENWEDYAGRYNIRKLPDMKLVAYFSEMWFSEIRSDKKLVDPRKDSRVSRREEALKRGEYNAKTKDNESVSLIRYGGK